MFDIPVCLFIFKRDKAVKIIEQIAKVKPQKIYILADYGRTDEEKLKCDKTRKKVEDAIDWDCEVVKHYASENIGVYANIGLGAKWVFEREEKAIFLEDDNYPADTFFDYCKDMLTKFEHDDKIMWVCGTNYLINYKNNENTDVVFTRHMLPCGWASWSNKFLKYYDGELVNYKKAKFSELAKLYPSKKLAKQFRKNWQMEVDNFSKLGNPISWDYQMDFSLKYYDKFGIAPCYNQITNIGADADSIHGGVSMDNEMTSRFCENQAIPMNFPIKCPEAVEIDQTFEEEIGKIMTVPPMKLKVKLRIFASNIVRKIFNVSDDVKLKDFFANKNELLEK